MKILALLAFSLLPAMASAVEYKAGWQAEKFYDEVSACRKSVIQPAAQAYASKSAAANQPAETIRNDVISMLPLFEQVANMGCFCAVNEIAKAVDYKTHFGKGELKARLERMNKQIEGPICAPRVSNIMHAISNNKEEARKFRLN